MSKSKPPRALVLLSGGLDSQLAIRVLQNAGLEVAALTFTSPFFSSEKAERAVKQLGVEHIIEDISDIHFPIVLDPPHGRGKNMNPCIDCHGLMFRLAADIARSPLSSFAKATADKSRGQGGFDIVASGEVLGQRPFSQNKQALKIVEKIAGIEILRPLCAKNLEETVYEREGLVDRDKLLDFHGKNRKPQIALAAEFGIKDYPTPAGGCLLTDPGYSARLRVLLERDPQATPEDASLLKTGRFLPLGKKSFAMIGRDKAESEKLHTLESPEIYLIRMQDFVGPTALLQIKKPDSFEKIFPELAERIRGYGRDSKSHEGEIQFKVWGKLEDTREI
ncbi:MAG: tRNA 4-thiouridine(8) synthase ThiI [Patescibacteria group bacterium]